MRTNLKNGSGDNNYNLFPMIAWGLTFQQDYENKLMYFGSVDGVLAMYPVRT